ncbi:MAG: prepilin-type N-terminal cleavage/methylation domain-containing protein [Candidatus Magasanikbacteria bacterium]|nr:prepilin-type N-terminal cleavage/methylation domain-containing protein [Candidatus Magasanikbacteria bacterium]
MKKLGFTLIELLIVVSIIAILVIVVFTALNPLELFSESRNAQRWVKVSELLTGIHIYIVKNEGIVPNQDNWEEGIYHVLGTNTSGCAGTCGIIPVAEKCLDLTDMLKAKRISQMPVDPLRGSEENTGFYIHREEGTIITIGSCVRELNKKIELTR